VFLEELSVLTLLVVSGTCIGLEAAGGISFRRRRYSTVEYRLNYDTSLLEEQMTNANVKCNTADTAIENTIK